MNERIDEFAFEAGCNRHKFWDPKHPDLEGFIISQTALDKFAELIIQECITVVGKTPLGYRDYRNQIEEDMRSACVDSLKEHFRVEE